MLFGSLKFVLVLKTYLSKTAVKKVSAGNSVAEAIVKVKKMSNPNEPTFLTCPSNTKDIAIHITMRRIEFLRSLGVLKRSNTEYVLDSASDSLIVFNDDSWKSNILFSFH